MVVVEREGYPRPKLFEVSEKGDEAVQYKNKPRLGEVVVSQIFYFVSRLIELLFPLWN